LEASEPAGFQTAISGPDRDICERTARMQRRRANGVDSHGILPGCAGLLAR